MNNSKTFLTLIPVAYVALSAFLFHNGLEVWALILVVFSIILALLVILVNAPTR